MRATTVRARARAERTARIEQAALQLFRTRGFDHVTVEDICGRAGVSPATFYRHFGTKDAVVFSYRGAFDGALREAIDAVADLPEHARLNAVLQTFARFLESQRETIAARDAIVLGHPRLLQQTLTVQRDLEAVLAAGLARLRGLAQPDPTARLEAGIGMLVLRVAFRAGQESGAPLITTLHDALAAVRHVVCRPSPPGPHRTAADELQGNGVRT
jgi:AcrR family transcriptional regulator